MSQTITLHLPDNFLQPLERTMRATKQPLETLLLTALQNALPPLEGLPAEIIANLEALELLEDNRLRAVLLETVPPQMQEHISALLQTQQARPLTQAEREQLASLQKQADLVMLRKAWAAVLLRFRGHRLPTLAELQAQTKLPT
jgi:prophage DNA circulation protein